MNCSHSLSTAANYQISHNQLLEADKKWSVLEMCLKNDSNLWFKIDTIESVVFLSIIMCWLDPFEALCQVQCKGVGGVWFFNNSRTLGEAY